MQIVRTALLLLVALTLVLPAQAQDSAEDPAESLEPVPKTALPSAGEGRKFLAFAEDAALVDRQWWEGQLEFADFDQVDMILVRAVVAFQPWDRVEVGGTVGFGNTDTPASFPDGSGATDLDVWGKYHFGTWGRAEWAGGGVVTIPTGDDNVGLGTDSFAISGFGAFRIPIRAGVISAHFGLRFNGDGQILGSDLEGKLSPQLGVAILSPISDRISVIGEARLEGERFDGGDEDVRVLGGMDWRVGNRGRVRGAIAFGLTDGAPDGQLLIGYAATF